MVSAGKVLRGCGDPQSWLPCLGGRGLLVPFALQSVLGFTRSSKRHQRLTISPPQQRRNQLQRLKLLRIAAVNAQEMQEVIGDDLTIDIILWSALLQDAQGFGEVLIQRDRFMPQLANK